MTASVSSPMKAYILLLFSFSLRHKGEGEILIQKDSMRLAQVGSPLGVGQQLNEGDEVPDGAFLLGEFARVRNQRGHARAADAGVDAPVEVKRTPPAAELVGELVTRLHDGGPRVEAVVGVAAEVGVALHALVGPREEAEAACGGLEALGVAFVLRHLLRLDLRGLRREPALRRGL